MAFCGNCGTEISDGVKFCPKCGTPVEAVSEATEELSDIDVEPETTPVEETVVEPETPVATEETSEEEAPVAEEEAPAEETASLFGDNNEPLFEKNHFVTIVADPHARHVPGNRAHAGRSARRNRRSWQRLSLILYRFTAYGDIII